MRHAADHFEHSDRVGEQARARETGVSKDSVSRAWSVSCRGRGEEDRSRDDAERKGGEAAGAAIAEQELRQLSPSSSFGARS